MCIVAIAAINLSACGPAMTQDWRRYHRAVVPLRADILKNVPISKVLFSQSTSVNYLLSFFFNFDYLSQ